MLDGVKARDVDRRMRVLAGRQHGVVSRDQLRAEGIDRQAVEYRVRSPDWLLVTRRVLRLVGAARTPEQRAMAATLDAGGVLSHAAAAGLWGWRGFSLDRLEVSRPRGVTTRRSRLATVHVSRLLPEHHRTTERGIPVTTLARTVVDLAGTEHPNRVEVALHAALRRGMRWPELHAVVDELDATGRAGIGVVKRLVEKHDGRPALGSGLEARFLRALLAAGLPEPRRQVSLGDGSAAGRVDFYYDDARLVIEVDGGWFHESPADVRRDKRRAAELVAAGFRVLSLSEDLIRSAPEEAVRLIASARRRSAGLTCEPR